MQVKPVGPRPASRGSFVRFDRSAIEQSIPRRFELQVDQYPRRLAVKIGDLAWTYAALDSAANRVGHTLLARAAAGVGPVVLLIEQSAALVAGILGVLKAGGIYVPLEATHPTAHVATVVEEAEACLILADAAGAAVAAAAAPATVVLRVDEILAGGGSTARPGVAVAPDACAYIYYTSGSTGRPKGVVDAHRNVLHNVMRYTNSLGIDRDDRLTLLQTPGFSGAVSSLFGALLNGAAIFPYDVRREGVAGLGAWLVRERISIYHSVPALFRLAAQGADAFPDLRLIRIEGDRMSRHEWILFRERCADGALLVNGLGATECGLVRQFFIDRTMPVTEGVVPIGYAVEDMEVVILDEEGRAAGPGQAGEIAVRSRYLAAGYWRRPDLYARAFARDPVDPELRTYRTGDLGRRQPDGCLDHLGRRDARQRIQGQWVDLAEVEAALLGAENVREAATRVHSADSGDALLVAYVVPQREPAPTVSALRRYLGMRLPKAAMPAQFIMLQRLPLSAYGKLDRSALPLPVAERPRLEAEFVAPGNRLEQVVAAIWTEVLGLDRIGIDDPFFDLGGDSLRMGQVQARLRDRLAVEVPMVALFEHPTIGALARYLEGEVPSAGPPAEVQMAAAVKVSEGNSKS